MDNMKIMEPNQHSYYDDNLNSKIIMKQVNSPGLTLNYSGESTLTRKPKMHFLVNGGSLPRSMTLQSKEKVHPSNDFKTNVGQQMDETCQQLARLTSQSGSLHQPTSSATVTSSTATNKSGSKLTKTITSPCLRKLRSTLFPGSRDSRRAPILVNNTTELESPNDQYNEDNQNNDDDIINPPLSARSISTPALNLQLATQPPEADYRPYPASNFSHSSTILHQQQHQMMPIMNSSMCNHYSGNVHYNNQSQQQFNDAYYLRDNYANYNNNNGNSNSKYYTSNDNIGPDRSYLTATPASCNYGYLPNQVYSNQQSRTLPQLHHQQHQQQQQPQHLIPKTNSNNQHQCPARVDTNCSQLTNNNVDKIYNSPQTIGPQQQYHQQSVKVQSQHRFVEVCRPEELRQNDNYVSSSSINKNNDRKSASEQDLGSHIVVVSSYENNQTHGLTVKNSSASHNKISEDESHLRHYHQPEASSPIDDECKTDNALNHMIVTSASSPDLAYKSSSDSGRGTRTSESGSAEVRDSASVSPPLDITSLDSDQTDSHRSDKQQQSNPNPSTVQSSAITLDKMQADLKKILEDDDELTSDGGGININTGLSLSSLKNQCSRLPVVHESDSWISDSSKTVDEPEKSSSKKIESNSAKKKDPPTTLSQQQSIKGSLTANRNLLMNGRGEISGNINKNGLLSKKLQPTEKSLPSKVNGNTLTTDISSTNNQITGPNKTPNKPKLGQTHLSNVKYGGIGKGLKLTTNKRWRHPLAEETGSVTTLGLESVDDVDDLTSEYTANTDAWENHENVHVRKQLSGLENMYSEILNLLGSRMHGAKKSMHHSSSGKLNRRLSGSVSSLSVASRDAFYSRNNKYLHRRDDFDSKGARRLKRLEGHVITLARSVSQLSSEIRSSQCLVEDVQTLRKDVDRIQEQLRCFKLTPLMDGGTLRRSTANNQSDPKDSTDKIRTEATGKNNKLDKIKRFFGDEPPLRQFLKKLGYEKYASKFESEKIGLKELSALNEEKLIKLGIPMGPRVRILQELNKIHSPHSNIYLV